MHFFAGVFALDWLAIAGSQWLAPLLEVAGNIEKSRKYQNFPM